MINFSVVLRKFLFLSVLFFSLFSIVNASVNVVDVLITENVYESVKYNPLGSTVGDWASTGENQSIYSINGTIVILNNHPTEAIQNIILNFTNVSNVYNLSYLDGSLGIVSEFDAGNNYLTLVIPDLPAGVNSTFIYNGNTTSVAPPINFTSSYDDDSIFAGFQLGLTDTVENTLNSTLYSETCVYDLLITQNSLGFSQSGGQILNFTFDNSSLTGSDSSNVSFSSDNRTLTWDLWAGNCFESTNLTSIAYSVDTPSETELAQNYEFINTTISYTLNDTVSLLNLVSISAVGDLGLTFEKYQENVLTGDNATWRISGEIISESNITVNLTSVTFWVSQRNGTGTGFTNPSLVDVDTVSGLNLSTSYSPGILLNSSQNPWNNTGSEWRFNYTFSSSPIVWMDLNNVVYNDGTQLTNRSVSYGNNTIYVKEVYLVTGYWLEITRNITRLSDDNFNILIEVSNLGSAPTPTGQAVVVYNFIPNNFALNGTFLYSSSTWYNTSETNESLNDATYNGTMYQYALIPNGNPSNSSLDKFGTGLNSNNSWSVEFNVTGSGEYAFDDLFLTGVDPLNVKEYGAIKALNVESVYKVLSAKTEFVLVGLATILGALILVL